MDWTRIINGDAYETDMFISNLIYDIASGEHDLNDMAKKSYNKYTEKLNKLTKSLRTLFIYIVALAVIKPLYAGDSACIVYRNIYFHMLVRK